MNWLLTLARSILLVYFFLYVLIHICLLITPKTANFLIFQNYLKRPFNDYKNPTKFGLNNVHNFYLETELDVKVGIWHFIPAPLVYNYEKDSIRNIKEHFETFFKVYDERPIIIYAHGCDSDRAEFHRRSLCQNLGNLGYHVFMIDYRGYGDSSGWPSEEGVVKDLMVLYNFIKSYQNQSRIFLWGHSLGTGISAHAAKILSEFNSPPSGVILEAPFKNISQAAKDYIFAPLILNNRWIVAKGDESLEEINLRLNTAENILKINSKILLFHAEDDWFIPYDRSRELIEICKQQRPKEYPEVKLIEFEKSYGYGHLLIYQHPEIYPMIKNFIGNKQIV